VKSKLFARAFCGQREPEHAFQPGDEGGDQILAGHFGFFGRSQCACQHGGAGMHAGRRLAQIVELEGVREGAVGEGCPRRAGAAKT
jgi:hypothetical protein